MGKNIIYTYSCDNCKADFKSPDHVISIDGKIVNGEGQKLFEDILKPEDVLCKKCFVNIIKDQIVCGIIETPIEVKTEETVINIPDIEYVTLRKIETIDDENTFIEYLGHVSRENFSKIYNKSLIGCYYPVEESCIQDPLNSFVCEINLIYKAFAGIPQIKKINAFTSESPYMYANKSVLMDN